MINNPVLIEEYPREYTVTQFEKIIITAKRAKDIHNLGKTPLVDTEHKAGYLALEELQKGKILPVYRAEDPVQALPAAQEDDDDDDD